MRPTRPLVLLAIAVVTGALTHLGVRLVYGDLPQLPRFAPASLLLVAFSEAVLAVQTRARLAGRPATRPVEPIVVARYAALAKASSVVGALATGAYVGVLGYVLPRRDAPDIRSDAWTSVLGAVAALALVAAAYALERVCRVKQPPEPPPAPG